MHQSTCLSVTSLLYMHSLPIFKKLFMNIVHTEAVLSAHLIGIIAVFFRYSIKSTVQSEINCNLCTVCCYPPKDCNLYPIATLERPVKINKDFDMAAPFHRLHLTYVQNQIITDWKEEKVNEINFFENEDIKKL